MDGELRLLATELLNLSEEFDFATKSEILSQLKLHQRAPDDDPSTSKEKKLIKESKTQQLIKQLFGVNVISFWTIVFFFTVFLWWPNVRTVVRNPSGLMKTFHEAKKNTCIVESHQILVELGRPTFDCRRCQNLTEFPVERSISRTKFMKNYAFTGIPVLVKDAVSEWNAFKNFSYDWFQELYDNYTDSFEAQEISGQFFPYKTEFETLEQALHMSEDRKNKSWYFGWSNAHPDVAAVLRQQYTRPGFLPPGGDSHIDWMFMGTRGKGAMIHLDNVARPSWQAQIRGIKTWHLVPSPECQNICHEINATMHPGDIVIVDTNAWYHGTEIWPGDISITIGSEYD